MVESKSLVFETRNASLHQCDDSERYVLRFFDQTILLHPCELIAFRRKINAVDIVSLFDSNNPDVEFLSLPSCDRLFVLTIREILELSRECNP